jgi:hypothetical protein
MHAVKIVKFNKDHDQDKVLREVKALAKYNHNNVVGYFTAWIELRVVWSSDENEGYDEEVGCEGATFKDPNAMLFNFHIDEALSSVNKFLIIKLLSFVLK